MASGGAGRPEHLADAIQYGKADAALAASIFHFRQYSILETKRMMQRRGVPVRFSALVDFPAGRRTNEGIEAIMATATPANAERSFLGGARNTRSTSYSARWSS